MLQRCACGGKKGPSGECAACRQKRLARKRLQASLRIGPRDDVYEREADRIADAVMRAPSGTAPLVAPLGVQRVGTGGAGMEAPASVDAVLASPGRPLDAGTRSFMEARMGHDFSGIRIHTDARAASSARAVGARAYTVGNNVAFGAGEYAPGTPIGLRLLAHELVHTIQQGESRAGGERVQRQIEDTSQFIADLLASIQESPSHAPEILGEAWDSIVDHWISFTLTMAVFVGAEVAIGALAAAPEPTMITKIVSAALQALVFAMLGTMVVVEVYGAGTEAVNWWEEAAAAHGDPARVSDASRSFCRMALHIVLAVMAAAGIRARVAGAAGRAPGARAPQAPPEPTPTPNNVIELAPRRAASAPPASSPPTGGGGGHAGNLALAYEPAPARGPVLFAYEEPLRFPLPAAEPVPPAVAAPAAVTATPAGPGMASAVGTGAAAGTSAALATDRQPEELDCGPLPISWPHVLPFPDSADLVRTPGTVREWEGLEPRGRAQRALATAIRDARAAGLPPPSPCFQNSDHLDHPNTPYDAHHIHPLYLGGEDYPANLCALHYDYHVQGHPALDNQMDWLAQYQQCGIQSGYLSRHPEYTRYVIVDQK